MLSEIDLSDVLINREMLKVGLAQSYIWWDDPINKQTFQSLNGTSVSRQVTDVR